MIRDLKLPYNGRMTRAPSLFLFSLALIAGACSSTANQAPDDGGVRELDAGPDSGLPATQAECRTEGYPCSTDEVAPEVRALSRSCAGQVQERMNAGESFEQIAAWLETQPDVVQVVFQDDALRFRVEGGAPRWAYVPIPGIMDPPPTAMVAKSNTSVRPKLTPKRVIRENDSQTEIKKKALILEPFEEYIDIPTMTWREELSKLHDYERVDYFANRDVGNAQFANWNDYRFVWVNTHGKHIEKNGNVYTILFSSRMCEEHGWLREELEAGRGDELTQNGVLTLRNLFGESGASIQANLTDAQRGRFEAYEQVENGSNGLRGQHRIAIAVFHVEPSGRTLRRNLRCYNSQNHAHSKLIGVPTCQDVEYARTYGPRT